MKRANEIAKIIMEMDSTAVLVLEKFLKSDVDLIHVSDQYPMYDLAHLIMQDSSPFDREEYISESVYDVEDPMADNTNSCGRAIGRYIIELHEDEIYEAMNILESYQINDIQEMFNEARSNR